MRHKKKLKSLHHIMCERTSVAAAGAKGEKRRNSLTDKKRERITRSIAVSEESISLKRILDEEAGKRRRMIIRKKDKRKKELQEA